MPPTAAQLSLASNAVKREYGAGSIPSAVAQESPTFDEFLKNPIRYRGGGEVPANTSSSWTPGIRFAVIVRSARSVGSRGQMGALPGGKTPGIVQTQADMTYLYGCLPLEGQQIELSSTDKEAFLDVLSASKELLARDLAVDAERQMFSVNLGTVLELVGFKIRTTDKYIREGDVIDTYALPATKHGDSLTVTLLDYDTAPDGQVWATLDAVTSIVEGDSIYREDAKGYEVTTFDSALSSAADNNDSYLGVLNSTWSAWQALVKSNVGVAFDLKAHVIDPVWALYKRYGAVIDTLYVDEKIATDYAMKYTTEVRRLVQGKLMPLVDIDAGFGDGLVITHPSKNQQIVMKVRTFIPSGTLYGIEKKWVGIACNKEPRWMPGWFGPGSIFTQMIDGDGKKYDGYEAFQSLYWLLVHKKRNGLKVTGIV